MASWVLVPCLRQLFGEFDRIAPARSRASDGTVGDTAHQGEVSDHNPDETGRVPIHDADKINEVHAADVTAKLNEPGLDMERVVQFLVARCRAGAEKRLRYIIYNRRIWSASSGWVQKIYTGASPHTEHAHFSASYETAHEASTASWHLEDIPVALTPQDKKDIIDGVVDELLGTELPFPYDPARPTRTLRDLWRYIASRDVIAEATADRVVAALKPPAS